MFLVRNKCLNYNKYVNSRKIKILLKNEITNKNITLKRTICSTNVIWNPERTLNDIYQSDYLAGNYFIL